MAGLPKRRKYRTNKAHELTTVGFVDRDFRRDRPDALWMTDITEHPTREGIVFCCVVLDAWSRRLWGGQSTGGPPLLWSTLLSGWQSRTVNPLTKRCCILITVRNTRRGRSPSSYSKRGLTHSLGSVGDAYDNAGVEADIKNPSVSIILVQWA